MIDESMDATCQQMDGEPGLPSWYVWTTCLCRGHVRQG